MGGGKWNATTVLLEPLDARETEQLLAELGGVSGALRERIVQVAEGNPLFLEEMLALVRDSGGRHVEVPPTIRALLAARLDQLDAPERAVLERGSVEGRTFHRGAVAALTDGNGSVDQQLTALVRKELVRPDRSELSDDDAYRFRHLLIRDAAYEALPKAMRADLHERFADWLQDKVGERQAEYEAVIGHHLQEAHRYRSELGIDDPAVAERAGRSLASAGWAAVAHGDSAGAVSLFARALDLLPADHPERGDLLIAFGHAAYDAGEYRRSSEAAEELIRLGREQGDERLAWRGRMQAIRVRGATDPTFTTDEMRMTAEAAIPILEQAGDQAGLGRALHLLGDVHDRLSRTEEQVEALELALEHARQAGDTAHEAELMGWLAVAYVFGPTPAEQVQRRLEQILAEAREKSVLSLEGFIIGSLGAVEGLHGRFDEARNLFQQGRAILTDLSLRSWIAGQTQMTGYVEMLAGDYAAAEHEFRFGYEEYERMGETGIRSTHAALLAQALYELGRDDEAEQYVRVCRDTAGADDYISQISWRIATARLLARRHELDASERLAREAFGFAGEGAAGVFIPPAWSCLGETLALAGKREEAEQAFGRAVELHERKGNAAGVAKTRRLVARLGLRPD